LATEPTEQQQHLVQAISEVSDRMTTLVREEIELAKAEMTLKVTRLARGAVVGIVAGVFVLLALMFGLHGLAWLFYWALPVKTQQFFWGFFLLALLLLVLAAVAGLTAFRFVKAGTPPTPNMAIDEAKKIRQTVGAGGTSSTEIER
jgi:uncharacterized membrane protein YgcG